MNSHKLEGRLGEATIRDDLRVMGKQTLEAQGTQYGETSSGVIYFDRNEAKLKASEDGGEMVDLISTSTPTYLSMKVLYVDPIVHTTSGTSEEIVTSFTLPGGTLAADGDFIAVQTGVTYAANANSKVRRWYFGATAHTNTTTISGGTVRYTGEVIRRSGTTQYGTVVTLATAGGAITGNFSPAETLANDITVKLALETPTAAGDITQQYAIFYLGRLNPTS
jgi:hypothetical protein